MKSLAVVLRFANDCLLVLTFSNSCVDLEANCVPTNPVVVASLLIFAFNDTFDYGRQCSFYKSHSRSSFVISPIDELRFQSQVLSVYNLLH